MIIKVTQWKPERKEINLNALTDLCFHFDIMHKRPLHDLMFFCELVRQTLFSDFKAQVVI
jgi:hypothetical protein